jgi:hypothetical protein
MPAALDTAGRETGCSLSQLMFAEKVAQPDCDFQPSNRGDDSADAPRAATSAGWSSIVAAPS